MGYWLVQHTALLAVGSKSMEQTVSLTVNRRSVVVRTEGIRSLLEVLREDLGLTGTKYGCGEGKCGACTVLLNGVATQACVISIDELDGAEVVTIEGLATDSQLHPVQEAFVAERAMQCGFCTSGMIMGAVSLLQENRQPSDEDIIAGMDGHICRCGGYPRIIQAVLRAAGNWGNRQP
jgi:aerobic-type carbon monoxide dehydrogenase small subunit (CoxS/CutS family)